MGDDVNLTEDQRKLRVLIEKKTVLNLTEAFAIAVKHYLRGEDGVFYADLYHLVKFLPSYALPTGIPSNPDLSRQLNLNEDESPPSRVRSRESPFVSTPVSGRSANGLLSPGGHAYERHPHSPSHPDHPGHLPLPATATSPRVKMTSSAKPPPLPTASSNKPPNTAPYGTPMSRMASSIGEESLFPAQMPPKWDAFDLFPFSLLVHRLTKKGRMMKGQKAARLRARLRSVPPSHNLPLEISLYLVRDPLFFPLLLRGVGCFFLRVTLPEFICCRVATPQEYRCSQYQYVSRSSSFCVLSKTSFLSQTTCSTP